MDEQKIGVNLSGPIFHTLFKTVKRKKKASMSNMPRKKRGRKAQQTVGLYCRIQIGQTCQNFVRCVSRKRHWGQDGN